MRVRTTVWLTIAVLAVIAGAALYVLVLSTPMFGCANTPIYEVSSPDRTFKAAVFERNCGATTDFTTQLSVLPHRSAWPDGIGNVLVVDTDHGRAPSGPGGGPEVRVRWEANDRLVIEHHANVRVSKAERWVGAVQINYVTFIREGV